MVKRLLIAMAIGAIVIGVIWIGQGTGVFPYPAASFMIDQTPWAYRGGALAAAGLIALLFLRK